MNDEQPVLDDVVDASQAAAILGVTRQHVVHLCKTGRLAGKRLTSTWITTRQAVEVYASSRRGPGRPKNLRMTMDDDRNIIEASGDQDGRQDAASSENRG
jgi:hypothetical protein